MSKLQVFPQIIRIFSALTLWIALGALISLNLANLPDVSNVLGVFSDYQEHIRQEQAEKEKVQDHYQFWQQVVKDKPDYRDAYITLASLGYQLSKPEEAKAYLTQAASLDPNSEVVEKLFLFFGR